MGSHRPVSIVILTYNNLPYTQECLEAIEQTTEDFEVIVIDNASSDETPAYLSDLEERKPWLKVTLNRSNRGFAGGCNQGVSQARHGTVCLLNNDAVPFEGWLTAMLDVLEKGVGIVGAKLLLPDLTLQHCGIEFAFRREPQPHYWPYHRYLHYPEELEEANRLEPVPAVTAACLLTSKTTWDRVGGMDEGYRVANFEDVDFNLAVREAGMKVMYQPEARLIHYWGTTVGAKSEGASAAGRAFQRNFERLQQKWAQKLNAGLDRP